MKKQKLATLNLRIESDYYNFRVMVGPSVAYGDNIEIADPRRSSVQYCAITPLDDRIISRLGLTERRIEIKSDDGSAIEACPEQLALALRLYRPDPFWLSPWINRAVWRDVKPFGTELGFTNAGKEREYSLDTDGLESFSRFAERLAPFHFNRNVYRLLRHHPAAVQMSNFLSEVVFPSADPARILPDEDLEGTRFVQFLGHIMVAVEFFERAGAEARRSEDLRLLFLMIATEALVGDDTRRDGLRDRIAQRISVLRERTNTGEPSLALIQRLYTFRNALVHGTAADGRRWGARKGETILNYGFLRPPTKDVDEFSDLVRECLLHALSLLGRRNWSGGPVKMDTIKGLDRAAKDTGKARRIREDVAAFWEMNLGT